MRRRIVEPRKLRIILTALIAQEASKEDKKAEPEPEPEPEQGPEILNEEEWAERESLNACMVALTDDIKRVSALLEQVNNNLMDDGIDEAYWDTLVGEMDNLYFKCESSLRKVCEPHGKDDDVAHEFWDAWMEMNQMSAMVAKSGYESINLNPPHATTEASRALQVDMRMENVRKLTRAIEKNAEVIGFDARSILRG